MTIYELKKLNRANGGHFFDRNTMKVWGDTLKGLSVKRDIIDPNCVVVSRKNGDSWLFNRVTGRMVIPLKTGGANKLFKPGA